LFERKYVAVDGVNQEDDELSILEILYYHSAHNPRYIQELHKALVEIGMKLPNNVRQLQLRLKEGFKETELWEQGVLFTNRRVRDDHEDVFSVRDTIDPEKYVYRLSTSLGGETDILEDEGGSQSENTITRTIRLNSFSLHLLRSALARVKFYEFRNLQLFFPNLRSVKEFIQSENYLGQIDIDVTGTEAQFSRLSPEEKLQMSVAVLQKLADDIRKGSPVFKGTKVFEPVPIRHIVRETIDFRREYKADDDVGTGMHETTNTELHADLTHEDWYIYDKNYGTSEEKALVKYIQGLISVLREHYQDIYLLRNEKLFKIFDFAEGRPFEPDFVLFLTEKATGKQINYQLFMEPKGSHLIATDQWKEDFLKQIQDEAQINVNLPLKGFRLIGLPFFNSDNRRPFEHAFQQLLP
jgi:type III restriction enzyme